MIKVLGVPYDLNSSFLRGPGYAPDRIRIMDIEGSANRFSENGTEIIPGQAYTDLGDLDFPSIEPRKVYEFIQSQVGAFIETGDPLLSIGGDHSVSFPIIEAHAERYPNLHILHFDAHGDLYENFDDNPFSHASPFARLMETGKIASLTQVGIRTLNTHQTEQAKKYGVKQIEMRNLNDAFLRELSDPLYISLDIDVLDPAFAPGVSHHEPGGLSTRQLIDFILQLPHKPIGADLVEYNPKRDLNDMTAMVGYKLMKELIAKMI